MDGRMNQSQCVPPSALCLQFPSRQACTEGLPLMLQSPSNFPLVMGILQEINQEKVGFSSCTGDAQRPLTVSEVKQESADVEEHHQSLNPELCQEWSLKGVEELLTDLEDLQFRDDCLRQAHEPGVPADLEACASDEKPLIGVRYVQTCYDQNALQEAQPPVDEKPLSHTEMASSLEEQLLFQENAQHVDEKPKTTEVLLAARTQLNIKCKCYHAAPAPFQVHVEDRLGLHTLQAVKREPEEMEAEARPCNEGGTLSDKGKGSNEYLIACWSAVTRASNRFGLSNEVTLPGNKLQLGRTQAVEPVLKLHEEKRRRSTDNIQRNTKAVLALPADVSEREKSDPGIVYTHLSPSTSMSLEAANEVTKCTPAPCEKGQVLDGDRKPQSVTSMAEPDCCKLTLGLASKPQLANLEGLPLDCSEDKPVVKPFIVQEKHDGQCPKTSPHHCHRPRKRRLSREYDNHAGQDTMSECPQRQLFPAITDGCTTSLSDKDAGGNRMEQMSKDKDCHKVFLEPRNFKLKPEAGQDMPVKSDCRASNNACGDEIGSRKTLQLMPQSMDEGAAPLKQGGIQENMSAADEDSPVREPNSAAVAIDSSSKDEVAPLPTTTEPQKKRMRGTLPAVDEKRDGISDTRCNRSDGKSWRCVRECINGAYYCQYHLRKRRIGYNRRKNNKVNPDDLEAVSRESSKSINKSR